MTQGGAQLSRCRQSDPATGRDKQRPSGPSRLPFTRFDLPAARGRRRGELGADLSNPRALPLEPLRPRWLSPAPHVDLHSRSPGRRAARTPALLFSASWRAERLLPVPREHPSAKHASAKRERHALNSLDQIPKERVVCWGPRCFDGLAILVETPGHRPQLSARLHRKAVEQWSDPSSSMTMDDLQPLLHHAPTPANSPVTQ